MKAREREKINKLMGQMADIVNKAAAAVVTPTYTEEARVAGHCRLLHSYLTNMIYLVRIEPAALDYYLLAAGWMRNIRERQPVEWTPLVGRTRKVNQSSAVVEKGAQVYGA